MRRLLSFTVPLLIALTLPALAQASTGTVLSVSRSKHQIQIVTAGQVVHAYRFGRHQNLDGVQRGTQLSFNTAGSRITHARALGTASTFSFLGQVVSSDKTALVLSLGDARQLRLATTHSGSKRAASANLRAHCDSNSNAAPTVTIEISGLEPGETVLVTESTDSSGTVTIAITMPPGGGSTSGSGSTTTSGGSADANWIGTITAVSATSISVDAGADNGGTKTFSVEDSSVTLGFILGDSVNVTYEQDGSDFVAEEVQYNNTLTSGVVTALAQAAAGFDTITMTDDFSGRSETFYVPDDLLEGQGTLIGDDVSVSYYQAARGLTLDHLQDNGPAN